MQQFRTVDAVVIPEDAAADAVRSSCRAEIDRASIIASIATGPPRLGGFGGGIFPE